MLYLLILICFLEVFNLTWKKFNHLNHLCMIIPCEQRETRRLKTGIKRPYLLCYLDYEHLDYELPLFFSKVHCESETNQLKIIDFSKQRGCAWKEGPSLLLEYLATRVLCIVLTSIFSCLLFHSHKRPGPKKKGGGLLIVDFEKKFKTVSHPFIFHIVYTCLLSQNLPSRVQSSKKLYYLALIQTI